MERGEWENEPDYPGAPLPAHERTWRHPSEMGAAQWVQSEPPLVVGRGLSVATGTVGVLIAAGLLWLLIPHQSRGGVAIEESTTSLRLAAAPTLEPVGTLAPLHQLSDPDATVASVNTVAAITTLASAVPVATTARSNATSTVASSAPQSTASSSPVQAPATAVALKAGHLVVTTAAAAEGRTALPVRLTSGSVLQATVVTIDDQSGTAVLALPQDIDSSPYQPSTASASSAAVVVNLSPTKATVWSDGTGIKVSYTDGFQPAEGSLVLDADGDLMGMCTMSTTGVRLVGVSSMLDALDQVSTEEAPAWLGIQAIGDDTGVVSVRVVVDNGPSAAAGLLPQDVIQAVDGVAVADLASLRDGVLAHQPGDQVVLSVLRGGNPTPVDVQVVLGHRPWSS